MSASCIITALSIIFLVASICCELISFLTTHMIDSLDNTYAMQRRHQGIFRSCNSNHYANCVWFDFSNYEQMYNSNESEPRILLTIFYFKWFKCIYRTYSQLFLRFKSFNQNRRLAGACLLCHLDVHSVSGACRKYKQMSKRMSPSDNGSTRALKW